VDSSKLKLAVAGIAGALAIVAAAPVLAQTGCAPLCAVSCVKPISIPDRWDDVTGIAGYMGGVRMPNWRLNNAYDFESFMDGNANLLHDDGEAFEDNNGNGIYDAEAYDPIATGYIAGPEPSNALAPSGDLGLELILKASNGSKPAPGQFYAVSLPPINRGAPVTGDPEYRANFADCNPTLVGPGDRLQPEPGNMILATDQAMRAIIAEDPNASWDAASGQLVGSAFPQSPRVILLAVHDPRIPLFAGGPSLGVTKIVAFFLDQMTGTAQVRGHFMRAIGSGLSCASGGNSFVVECPTPATPTSWGRIKGAYR
jgi:hypothetical protein